MDLQPGKQYADSSLIFVDSVLKSEIISYPEILLGKWRIMLNPFQARVIICKHCLNDLSLA